MSRIPHFLLCVSLLAACHVEHDVQAHVERDARIPMPVLVFARALRPDMITVQALGRYPGRVGGLPYWTLAAVPGGRATALSRLRYGETPPGYIAPALPLALFPGRYELAVTVAGQVGRSYFRVRGDGAVVDVSAVF